MQGLRSPARLLGLLLWRAAAACVDLEIGGEPWSVQGSRGRSRDCTFFGRNPNRFCSQPIGSSAGSGGYTAAEVCCACGGGVTDPPTSAPSAPPTEGCQCTESFGVEPPVCPVLVELYNATGGAGWERNDGWCSGTDYCAGKGWYGIDCQASQSALEIVTLDLRSNGLRGTLPASLGNLTSLRSDIWMSDSALSGTLPSSLGNLASVRMFRFFGNKLSGSIPETLGHLYGTSLIDLQSNRLSGSIPSELGTLPKLVSLYIHENAISGTIPDSLGYLHIIADPITIAQSGKALSFYNNRLSGTMPASLGQLEGINKFLLNGNRISGTIPDSFASLSSMWWFYIHENPVSGTFPGYVSTWPQLQRLVLNSMAISGTIPKNIGNLALSTTQCGRSSSQECPECQYYQHSDIQRDACLQCLGEAPCMDRLALANNSMRGSIPPGLTSLTRLVTLLLQSNHFSGTIPPTLGALEGLGELHLTRNSLSGGIPDSIGQLASLKNLGLAQNQFTGTLPKTMGSLLNVSGCYFAYNRISGSLPPSLSGLTNLKHLAAQGNSLEGSSSPSFNSSWTNLELLSLFNNPSLDWDLQLLSSYQSLHTALFQGCGIQGTLPNALSLSSLETLLLNGNKISGTIPSSLFNSTPGLITLVLSDNQDLSGTLPSQLFNQLANLTTLLANGLRLSGTIPSWTASRRSNSSLLRTLSLARNYLRGRTTVLEGADQLQTLLLSSNYFSCNAPALDSAIDLGTGTFLEPARYAMKRTVDDNIADFTVALVPVYHAASGATVLSMKVDPFEGVEQLRLVSIALAFSGCPALTAEAAYLPPTQAGNLLTTDRIRRGRHGLFSGHSDFKMVLWLLLPTLLLAHLGTILVVIWPRQQGSRFLTRLATYLQPFTQIKSADRRADPLTGVLLYTLEFSSTRIVALVLAVLGMALIYLNSWAENIYKTDGGCSEPLIDTTHIPILPEDTYSYSFVVLASLVSFVVVMLAQGLAGRGHSAKAERFLVFLDEWCTDKSSGAQRAVSAWHRDCVLDETVRRSQSWWCILLYYLAHIPVVILASCPACAYILAINTPESNIFTDLCRSSLFITLISLLITSVITPQVTAKLAAIRYRIKVGAPVSSPYLIRYYKLQAHTAVAIKTTTVIIAPLIVVFLLDESCLRYYLKFDSKLAQLLSTWGIGVTGFDAYRYGFCSRKLLTEYTYVWLQSVLISGFMSPTRWLALKLPLVQRLMSKLDGIWKRCKGPRDSTDDVNLPARLETCIETHRAAFKTQEELANLLTTLLLMSSFGSLVPPLLLLMPVIVWVQICACRWCSLLDQDSFGALLAHNVLVQAPLTLFRVLVLVLSWIMVAFIMIDLEFGTGPLVLFAILIALQIAFLRGLRQFRQRGQTSAFDASLSECNPELVLFQCDYESSYEPITFDHVNRL